MDLRGIPHHDRQADAQPGAARHGLPQPLGPTAPPCASAERDRLGPRQPLAFGTVTVAARVVSDAGCTAIVALLDMAAEHRRPARRDGAHDPSLDAPEMTGA